MWVNAMKTQWRKEEKKKHVKSEKKAQFLRMNTYTTTTTTLSAHKIKTGKDSSSSFFLFLNCWRCCYCCSLDFSISFYLTFFLSWLLIIRSYGLYMYAFLYLVSSCLLLTRADHRGENCKTESKRRLKRKIIYIKKNLYGSSECSALFASPSISLPYSLARLLSVTL